MSDNDFGASMKILVNVAAGLGIAGTVGGAALGFGTATAEAAAPATQAGFAQWGLDGDPDPGRGGWDHQQMRNRTRWDESLRRQTDDPIRIRCRRHSGCAHTLCRPR